MAEILSAERGISVEEALERGKMKSPEELVAGVEERQRFGARVGELRVEKGLSVEELAASSAVDVEVIEALETGRNSDPYIWEMKALCEALGTKASAILRGIEESQP